MHPDDTPDDKGLLNQGGEPCIWMTAGMLAWKLCDRGFDCERCPLDAALQRDGHRTVALPPAGVRPPQFPDDRRYHPGHGWALEVADGRIRCGLDAFAARFAAHASSVVLGAIDSRIERGRVGAWLIDDTELLPLRAPVSGRIVARNLRVQCDTALIAREPYDGGWLYEVRGDRGLDEANGMLTADQMREQSDAQQRQVRAEVARDIEARQGGVGPTMADGGEALSDLRHLLGVPRYHRLVRLFLG